jgi:hypothetical protein
MEAPSIFFTLLPFYINCPNFSFRAQEKLSVEL